MGAVVEQVLAAIEGGRSNHRPRGDFDVDGVSATTLLVSACASSAPSATG